MGLSVFSVIINYILRDLNFFSDLQRVINPLLNFVKYVDLLKYIS